MKQSVWSAVDRLIEDRLIPDDKVMQDILAANRSAGLPAIDVSPAQGRMLELFVRMSDARNILEIGTLGGYSTVWMTRGLPADGRITTLELDPRHAKTAVANFERAGVADRIDIHVGPADLSLAGLETQGVLPFDLVFIDADKPSNPVYLDYASRLGRAGTVVICDNVIRNGDIAEDGNTDPNVVGALSALKIMGNTDVFAATAIQTVGGKGYDGFALGILV